MSSDDIYCRFLDVSDEILQIIYHYMFLPLDILFEYWIEHVTFGLLLSSLAYLLGYSTGKSQVLQLIVLAVFCPPFLEI